jgi:hypothetical protein
MNSLRIKYLHLVILIAIPFINVNANQHPGIFLTPNAVKEIKSSLGKYPGFDKSYNDLKEIADKALLSEIIVPVPKDGGGGYTHEKHKNNYYEMNACGILFQITSIKKYAEFVKSMLLKYADLYPTIGMHPIEKSGVRGKLFWQSLNDAVWLFHTANAYDCVFNYLSVTDRTTIENNVLKPEAEFLSNGNDQNYKTFNKMHNHGTWSLAAVGMVGYAMNDKDLIEKALKGSNKDGQSGFIKQLDVLFSPEGYFTEGPYYQRYAIWPFITFAQVIQNQQPELKIFKHRDGILMKAVNTLLQLSYKTELFYLNDALQKNFQTQEIIYAVDIAYANDTKNTELLDIASQQNSFTVTGEGLATAKAVAKVKNKRAFDYKSILLRDGQNGEDGGLAIFRAGEGENHTCLTFKGTSHGLSHGHYDKLGITLFDNGNTILSDYGASRFLNIEPKSGGGYTAENDTWAMQTIAHNTVTVDETSHFKGDIKVSSKFHSDILYCDYSNPKIQVVAGLEENAYEGVKMQRTTALINTADFEFPIVIDIFNLKSSASHTYDFPFYYKGQMVSTNFEYTKSNNYLSVLGINSGYEHLWLEASAKSTKSNTAFTWFNDNRFYSITTVTDKNTDILLTRLGANDPNFNLRNETAFMLRQKNASNHTFASVIEPHGLYDLVREVTINFKSKVAQLDLIADNDEFSCVKIIGTNDISYLFFTVNKDFSNSKSRTFNINNKEITFTGNYYFSKN